MLTSRVRIDTTIVACVSVGLLIGAALAGPSLRQFSTTIGLVAFIGLTWRIVLTWATMSILERLLALALAASLLASAIAQALLALSTTPTGDPPPANTSGIWALILPRIAVIGIVIGWRSIPNRFPPTR